MNLFYNIFVLIMLIILSISTVFCVNSVLLRNGATKTCLSSNGQSSVFTSQCDKAESWQVEIGQRRPIFFAPDAAPSGKCLTSDSHRRVFIEDCHGREGVAQKLWDTRTFTFLATGLCLTSDPHSNKVTTAQCNQAATQKWEQLEQDVPHGG